MKEIRLRDLKSTLSLGEKIGRLLCGGEIIAFRGPLGAGKTSMAKGIARGLDIEEELTSPTFPIISEYEGRLRLYHIDAYRLSGIDDFYSTGGVELLADPGGVCLIEWSERIAEILPEKTLRIDLGIDPDGSRRARIEAAAIEEKLA